MTVTKFSNCLYPVALFRSSDQAPAGAFKAGLATMITLSCGYPLLHWHTRDSEPHGHWHLTVSDSAQYPGQYWARSAAALHEPECGHADERGRGHEKKLFSRLNNLFRTLSLVSPSSSVDHAPTSPLPRVLLLLGP
eukprot:2537915-Rhodomonas_salina.2